MDWETATARRLLDDPACQSLIGSQGDPMTFLERPISLTCILIAVALVSYPLVSNMMKKRKAASA